MRNEILRMEQITTIRDGVEIVKNARLNVFEKEAVGLIGVNGSGRTALMQSITGQLPCTSGRITYFEKSLSIAAPEQARQQGIFYIEAASSLIENFTVVENIFLIRESKSSPLIHSKKQWKRAENILKLFPASIAPHALVRTLAKPERTLVEISRAVAHNASLIILDNVMGDLIASSQELFEDVFETLLSLSISIVIIETRLKPLLHFCHRLFVMRNGRTVGEFSRKQIDENKIISLMIGKKVDRTIQAVPQTGAIGKPVLLELRRIVSPGVLHGLDVTVYEQEVTGILNVHKNSGRAIQNILAGVETPVSGRIFLRSRPIELKSPAHSLAAGIAIVPEDDLLFMDLSLTENLIMSALPKSHNRIGKLDEDELRYIRDDVMSRYLTKYYYHNWFQDRIPDDWLLQKKIAFCRALASNPSLLVLMHPTKKMDVISKNDMYAEILQLKKRSVSVLVISFDIQELISLCDRIAVVKNGRTIDNLIINAEMDKEEILRQYGQYLRDV